MEASAEHNRRDALSRNWAVSLLCGAVLLVLGFILLVVVPSFGEMFREFGMTEDSLPRSTAFLLFLCTWLRRLWFLCVPVALVISLLAARIPRRAMRFTASILIVAVCGIVLFIVVALYLPCPPGLHTVR